MTKKNIYPVIHVTSKEQAFRNVTRSKESGADGVFLISHGSLSDDELMRLAVEVKEQFAPIWVGVNCLGLDAKAVAEMMPEKIDAIWVDNAHIDEKAEMQPYAEEVRRIIKLRLPDTLYFGGVAFKYQKKVSDYKSAVEKAAPLMDVVCTSGIGTGYAADIDKIKSMSGIAPLAIASGITPENITDYLPYVDNFLVATGISDSFTEINPDKLSELIANKEEWLSKQ